MIASAQIRWKKSADAAISFARYERERRELARCLAGRLLHPRGQHDSRTLAIVATRDRTRYEAAIAGILDEFSLRLSLAARHLHALHDNARFSDYDDSELLTAEANWARAYYEALFQCPIPMSPDGDVSRKLGERRSRSFDEFLATLEDTIVPKLHSALDSAA